METLDDLDVDLIVMFMTTDEEFTAGLPHLLDWRHSGDLARMKKSGRITGRESESVLVARRNGGRGPCDVLLVGVGNGAVRGTEVLDHIARVQPAITALNVGRYVAVLPKNAESVADAALDELNQNGGCVGYFVQ